MNKAPVVFRAMLLLGILIGVAGVDSSHAQYTRGTAVANESAFSTASESPGSYEAVPSSSGAAPALLETSVPPPVAPTIITNTIEFSPVMDFGSFPVDDLANQLKDINKEENEALVRATQEKFDALAVRLNAIESTLDTQSSKLDEQRGRDADLMGEMQKFTTTFVIVIASVCVLGMALVGYMLWRSNNQLAQVATGLSEYPKALRQSSVAGHLEAVREIQNLPAAIHEGSEQLKGALAQLESRIRELEQTSDEVKSEDAVVAGNVPVNGAHHEVPPEAGFEHAFTVAGARETNGHHAADLDSLLEQGESQINKGAFNKALNTFRKADEISPENPEILVKIGSVLEKLRKTEQAIEIYDRAIAKDPGLTIAYLYKGRAFNQMSRFDEALECYERALRTQS